MAFLLIVFTVFTVHLDASDRAALVPAVLRLTHSAFAGLGLLVAYGAYRKGRSGWWWYAVGALVPLVQFAVVGLWFVRTRRHRMAFGRWVI